MLINNTILIIWVKAMDIRSLREDRRHGSPLFPFATYEQNCRAGDPILENHWHDEAEFLWVMEGEAVFQVGLAEYELRPGGAVFIPSGEIHGGYSLAGTACTYRAMVFQMDWLSDSGDVIGTQYMKPLRRGDAVIPSVYDNRIPWGARTLERLTRLYELRETNDSAMAFRIKAELYLLFADLLSAGQWSFEATEKIGSPPVSEHLKAVIKHIESHCSEPLTVPELARFAGMSPGHFSRVFKSFMRKTPMEYVIDCRMRQAAYLLRDSDLSVGQVAAEVGVTNFSYFIKMFKSGYADTPSQYRKNFRSL